MAWTKEKRREYDKRYRELNKEKTLARHRKYKAEQKTKDPEGWRQRVLKSVKEYQAKNKEKCLALSKELRRKLDTPEKQRARWEVRKAIKKGSLIRPQICSNCHKESKHIDAHHPDYSKPLEVTWLCKSCHWIFNKKMEAIP